jgi:hypothetical protein
MADQADKSDDLIAELARLMATTGPAADAKGSSTVKVTSPPANGAPPRIRIPGMDNPVEVPVSARPASPQPAPTQPAPGPTPSAAADRPAGISIRIPGMEPPPGLVQQRAAVPPSPVQAGAGQPRPVAPPIAAATPNPSAEAPKPSAGAANPAGQGPTPSAQPQAGPSKFDFGALSKTPPVVNTEPLKALQDRQATTHVTRPTTPVRAPDAGPTPPAGVRRFDTEPARAEPVAPRAEPARPAAETPALQRAEPPKVEAGLKFESPRTEAPRIEPPMFAAPRFDAARPEPQRPQPVKSEARSEPAKSEPVKSEPVKYEPVRSEQPRPEVARAEPAKAEQVKAESVKAETVPPLVLPPSIANAPSAPPVMAPAPKPAETRAADPGSAEVADIPNFDFDFGFGAPAAPKGRESNTPPGAEGGSDASPDAGYDPIAALIAADLDAADGAAKPAPAKPVQAPPAAHAQAAASPRPAGGNAPPVQRAAPSVRPQPVEDSFEVPPIVPRVPGASTRSVADMSDPMSEIESLIGEAVRVDLTPREPTVQRPSQSAAPMPAATPAAPVVPPLNTQFPPRRAGIKDKDAGVEAAEQAIMAAAAATGTEIGRVKAEKPAEVPYRRARRQKAERPEGRSVVKPLVGLALAAVLLVAASLGLYWVLGMGRDQGDAPILSADAGPAKVPPAPAANSGEARSSVVFDELDGRNTASTEQLVPRGETDVAEVIAEVPGGTGAAASDNELANRKVRTVTVRPDGTIVSSDDAVAGAAALPVDRPNVPALPDGLTSQSELLAAAESQSPRTILPSASGSASAGAAGTGTGALALVPSAGTLSPEPAEAAPVTINPAAQLNPSLVAPIPQPRIANRQQRLAALTGGASSPSPVTAVIPPSAGAPAAQPAPTQAPVSSGAAVNANAFVQLTSLPTETEARQQASVMTSRWGSLFNGQGLVIQRAELSGGRVTYRVRLPANSLQSATQICASIKSNGGDCFATNS